MRHLLWAQERYRILLGGRDTFEIAAERPEVFSAANPSDFYKKQPENAAPNYVDELLRSKRLTRENCPYVFLVMFMSPKTDFPIGGNVDLLMTPVLTLVANTDWISIRES